VPSSGRSVARHAKNAVFLAFDCTSDAIGVCIANVGNDLSAQRRAYDAIAALIMIAVNAEAPRAS
jgi:hypothetical protein